MNPGPADAATVDGSQPSPRDRPVDVFVAHSPDDREWVAGYLLHALDQAGVTHESTLELGVARAEAVERAVSRCRRIVAVYSPAFVSDDSNEFLVLLAQHLGHETNTWPLVPVVLGDVELPARIAMLVGIDLPDQDTWEDGIQRLVTQLGRPLGPARPPPRCPYPGMRAYGPDDREDFVGRDAEVQELAGRLELGPRACVIGPSGSGKSSLVLAGLVPRLDDRLPAGETWRRHVVRPGPAAWERVAATFDAARDVTPAELAAIVERVAGEQRRLLVIDQAEEFFTGDDADGVIRVADLLERLAPVARVRTILTVRADFLGALMESPLWPLVRDHRFEVLPLGDEQLEDALVLPAARVGVYIEPALVVRLIADASGEPGMLPCLQATMAELWHRIERRLLTLRGYEALVLGARTYDRSFRNGLLVAVSRRADAVLADLDEHEAVVARRILLRLVQFGEGREDVRRQQTVDALRADDDDAATFDRALGALTAGRLVTTGTAVHDGVETPVVDLSHEALIQGWPTLRDLIARRQAGEVTRRELQERADRWVDDDRSPARLLDQAHLVEAEAWLGGEVVGEVGVGHEVRELVAASRTLDDRRRRRRRRLQATLVATTCAAVAFAAFALVSRRSATVSATRAQSLLLARIAASQDDAPNMGALLGLESLRRLESADGYDAVLRALAQEPATRGRLVADREELLAVATSGRAGLVATAGRGFHDRGRPRIQLWGLGDHDLAGTLDDGHDQEVTALAFSPDGTRLASVGRDDRVVVWDVVGRQVVATWIPSPARIPADQRCRPAQDPAAADLRTVAFSPDGGALVTAGHDQVVRVRDLDGGGEVVLAGHACDVMDVAVHPGGRLVASASRDDTVRVWDLDDPDAVRVLGTVDRSPRPGTGSDGGEADVGGDARAVAWSPDGRRLAAVGNDGRLALFATDALDAEPTVVQAHAARIFDVAFSPDGDRVATSGADRSVRVFRVADLVQVATLRAGARGLAWPRDDQLLAATLGTGLVVLDPGRTHHLARPLPTVAPVVGAVFSGDDVVGASTTGGLVRWRGDGTATTRPAPAGVGPATSLVAMDDHRVAVGHDDGAITTWVDGVAGEPVRLHDGPVVALAHVPATDMLVSLGSDATVVFRDAGSGVVAAPSLSVEGCTPLALAAAPDPPLRIAVGCNETAALRWWREGDDVVLASDEAVSRQARVNDLEAVADDGLLVVAGTANGNTTLWRDPEVLGWVDDPDMLNSTAGETTAVAHSATSPAAVVTGSRDGIVQAWDLASGRTLGPGWQLPPPIADVTIDATGTRAAVTTDDDVVVLDLDPTSWRRQACDLAGRDLRADEWARHVGDGGPVVSSCPP